jgi:hypothetical protein
VLGAKRTLPSRVCPSRNPPLNSPPPVPRHCKVTSPGATKVILHRVPLKGAAVVCASPTLPSAVRPSRKPLANGPPPVPRHRRVPMPLDSGMSQCVPLKGALVVGARRTVPSPVRPSRYRNCPSSGAGRHRKKAIPFSPRSNPLVSVHTSTGMASVQAEMHGPLTQICRAMLTLTQTT